MENNKIRIFNTKSNKNIFFHKYMFTVGERGNPHSPDSFLHVDKNECNINLATLLAFTFTFIPEGVKFDIC